ncbi:MAG: right-handed parallel beta-helix repeat-containing protein, partial [Thermoplasmata archaeon]
GFAMTNGEHAYPIAGLTLESVQNCRIFNNNVSSNGYYGVKLNSCSKNIVENNIGANNWYGLLIQNSDDNIIANNSFSTNYWSGIWIHYSRNNTLRNNTLIQDGIHFTGDLLEYWNTHDIDTSNTVSGKPVHYWKNKMNGNVPSDAGQVILANCTNVTVENQNLSGGSAGIELGFSYENTINNNSISSNDKGILLYKSRNNKINDSLLSSNYQGIYFWYSDYNSVTNSTISSSGCYGIYLSYLGSNIIHANNVISNNVYGFYIMGSKYNLIYHNNIISNFQQAFANSPNYWNASYPLGGNYWSDHSGVDNYKGPLQNIPGWDGIGDNAYTKIDGGKEDNYPLMEPYKPNSNMTNLKKGWNLISMPLIQQEQNLTRVLGSIDGWYDAVRVYDSNDTNDPWKQTKIDKPFGNDLSELNETMGFWIHITQPGNTIFLYNGTQPTSNQTIPFHPGWNLVGYPSLTSYNRTEGLNNLTFGSEVDAIWTFNVATKMWKEIGGGDYFEVGRGYWIHANIECEWEVPL